MHSGQSYGNTDNSLPSGTGFPDTTIFNALSRNGVSNQYFFTDIPVSALWGQPGLSRSSQVQLFYEQAATGTLPALSFVDPAFNGESQGTSGDEHPLADVRVGQAFIADVVHAFMESPQWRRGALFIVYDEWGGFFDHVKPPRVPDLRASRDLDRDFGQMGFRIPAVVASPYARRGHVDHSLYGFESILKLIRYRYGLPPLTPRDLYANNIAAAFDFDSEPDLAPPLLPQPAEVIASPCAGGPLVDSGGAGIDDGGLLGSPGPLPLSRHERARRERASVVRPKPHDLATLVTSGWLERLGFDYRPATPATMYRHPSKLGLTP
jgi:phospholipase C